MPIIDSTYFYGKISLPQVADSSGLAVVNKFIALYEPELLLKALGYQLSKDFVAGIVSPSPDQKWLDLLNGVEYTYGSYPRKWIGFKNAEKRSPIANYVYYMYQEDAVTTSNMVGVTATQADNSLRSDPSKKMADAWNEMVYWLLELRQFIIQNPDPYGRPPYYCWEEVYKTINVLGV